VTFPPLTLAAWLRYDVIAWVLSGLPDVRSILEVGCGEGALAVRLADRYEYVGVEIDPTSCGTAQARLARIGRGRVVCGDLSALTAVEFDLVCAFEVLEHIEDDVGALHAWGDRLHGGGWLLFSVPAFQSRWGAADRIVGHFRRYESAQAAELVVRAGFADVRVWTYGFPLGYVLEHARNILARRAEAESSMDRGTAVSGRWHQPPDWLSWGTQLATAPFRRLQRRFLDSGRGTGLIVLARKSA
jgi:SAM-dependent methyltransferase